MDIRHLHCFSELCETLSFSQTAKRLHITQPAVSRQIRLLEESLGVQLFIRSRTQVVLTPTGHQLKLQALPLFRELERSLASVKQASTGLSGKISFACLAEIGQAFFLPILLEFKKKHPDIQLQIEFLKEFEILEKVKAGSITFGIVTTPVNSETVRAFDLMKEQVVLVTRAESLREPNSNETIPLVAYRETDPVLSKFQKTVRSTRRKVPQFSLSITVNSFRSMIECLHSTDTFALMPLHSVESEIKAGRLRQVGTPDFSNRLYLIHLDNPIMEQKNRALKEHLLTSIRKKAQ